MERRPEQNFLFFSPPQAAFHMEHGWARLGPCWAQLGMLLGLLSKCQTDSLLTRIPHLQHNGLLFVVDSYFQEIIKRQRIMLDYSFGWMTLNHEKMKYFIFLS